MKTKTIYSLKAVQSLLEKYSAVDGEIIEAIEGTLGHGTTICTAHGKKSAVIQEVFINSWSSGHTITLYNKLPKKYEAMIKAYCNAIEA
jgi:hypothetical protein